MRLVGLISSPLVYKAGFDVARYVGNERLVENSKASYHSCLRASSEGWHEGRHSLLPWWEYLCGIALAAYQELDQKLSGVEFSEPEISRFFGIVIAMYHREHEPAHFMLGTED